MFENLLTQIENVDVNKGYSAGGNQLKDGDYSGYAEDLKFINKEEKGMLFILKLNTLQGDNHSVFYNISNTTIKFNMPELITSLFRISKSPLFENNVPLQIEAIQNPEAFAQKMTELIAGKECDFTVSTNKNGYKITKIKEFENMPF